MAVPQLQSPPLAPRPPLRVFRADQGEPSARPAVSPPKIRWLVVLMLCSVVSLRFDALAMTAMETLNLPGDVSKLVYYSEFFGHGVGVVLLCLLAGLIDPRGSWVTGYLLVHAFGAGLAADGLKLFFSRMRPYHVIDGGLLDFTATLPQWQLPSAASMVQEVRSFPSGHAAAAAGLAIGLIRLYPRGRLMFALLASLATVQRVVSRAHYPSDCFVGVTCAFVVAYLLYRPLRLHDRWLAPATPVPAEA